MCEVDYMEKLTDRQKEVYSLIVQGYTQRAIARQLSITPRTVQFHFYEIRQRTDSRSIIEAAFKLAKTYQQP